MKTYLDPSEVNQMEEAAEYLRDRLLIRVLFRLGCRISEALALKVNDIDFTSDTVTIKHLKVRINLSCPECNIRLSRSHRFCPGCGVKVQKAVTEERERRRVRTLPVDEGTLDMLRDYIDRGGPVGASGFLFGITRGHAWKIVNECAEAAGLPKLVDPQTGRIRNVSPHRLRDAFAVHAVRVDDSTDGIRMLQEHLGHAGIGTTMRYRKIGSEELKEWCNRLWEEG